MRSMKITLRIFIALLLTAALLAPASLWAQLRETREGYLLTEADVDTAYEIMKLVSVQNSGTRDENQRENMEDIFKLIGKNKGNAAVYITNRDSRATPDLLITDAVIVRYLSPEEIEKRNKSAQPPPVLKKESPLDPEPIVIEKKDVKFPYKIVGLLNLRADITARNLSKQSMDYKMAEEAARNRASAVLFVNYLQAGSDYSGAAGIMVKAYDTWEAAEAAKRQEVKMERDRKARQAEQAKPATPDSTGGQTELPAEQ